jgi:hypothetical protein
MEVKFTSRPLYPQGHSLLCPLNSPRAGVNSLPYAGIKPQFRSFQLLVKFRSRVLFVIWRTCSIRCESDHGVWGVIRSRSAVIKGNSSYTNLQNQSWLSKLKPRPSWQASYSEDSHNSSHVHCTCHGVATTQVVYVTGAAHASCL